MVASRLFSINGIIRLMILGGLLAILFVVVQSCQKPKNGLERFTNGSLRRLYVRENPPPQPSMAFTAPDGGEMRLSDYKGKVILVNAWASWCAPCIAEMPTLSDLQKQRGGENFEVVAISSDRVMEDTQLWLEENNIDNLTAFHDGSYSLAQKLDIPGLPVSVIYDKQGRELARVIGEADWTSPEALALIDAVIGD